MTAGALEPAARVYLKPDEVADLLRVNVKSVYRWLAADPSMPPLRIRRDGGVRVRDLFPE